MADWLIGALWIAAVFLPLCAIKLSVVLLRLHLGWAEALVFTVISSATGVLTFIGFGMLGTWGATSVGILLIAAVGGGFLGRCVRRSAGEAIRFARGAALAVGVEVIVAAGQFAFLAHVMGSVRLGC